MKILKVKEVARNTNEYPDWFLKLSTDAQKDYIEKRPNSTPRKLWDAGVRPKKKSNKKETKDSALKHLNNKQKVGKKTIVRKNITDKQIIARKEVLTELNKILKRLDKSGKSSVLALATVKDYKEYSSSAIIGKKVESAKDLAFISQIYRNPLMETFRVIYTKGGKVIGHNTLSQRLPASVSFKGINLGNTIYNEIKSLGADTYYLMHNHPSGKSDPSYADIKLTTELDEELRLLNDDMENIDFGGHIVINHKEYSFIDVKGNVINIEDSSLESIYEKPEAIVDNLVLGETIDNKKDLAKAAAWLYTQSIIENAVTFIGVNSKNVVNMAAPMPPSFFLENYNFKRVASYIRAISKTAGLGVNRFATISKKFTQDNANDYKHLIEDDIFLDIVDIDGVSIHDMFRTQIIPNYKRDIMGFKGKAKIKKTHD